jgi:hypothetical protein
MYDEIKARLLIQDEGQRRALLNSEAFVASWPNQKGHIVAKWGSFKLYLTPDVLVVSGSLHSFYHGHNGGRFNRTALIESIGLLSEALDVTADSLVVYRVEFGVNLPQPKRPTAFLDTLRLHRRTPFYPMKTEGDRGRPLGFTAMHDQYAIKCYDKGQCARLMNPHYSREALRFEIRVAKIKWLLNKLDRSRLTLADLPDEALMRQLGEILEQEWRESLPPPKPDMSGLKRNQALMILASRNVDEFESYLTTLTEGQRATLRKTVRALQQKAPVGEHPLTVTLQAELTQILGPVPVVPATPVGLPAAADF